MTDEQQLKQSDSLVADMEPQQTGISTAEMDIRLAHHIEKKVKPKSDKVKIHVKDLHKTYNKLHLVLFLY